MTEAAAAPDNLHPVDRFVSSKGFQIFTRLLDILMLITVISIIANTMNTWLVYKAGYNFLDRHFKILMYLITIRLVTVVPWVKFLQLSIRDKVFSVACAAGFYAFLFTLLMTNFRFAVEAVVITRASFQGATDDEIARDITEWNKWYPRMRFIQQMQEEIPEDAAIAYIGDQRAHIISYLLYPRRVYALPEMQTILNETIQENWTWSDIEDPFHPPTDPLNPVDQGLPQNEPDKELQQKFLKMIEDKNIGWVMYYDSLYPDKSWFDKIKK